MVSVIAKGEGINDPNVKIPAAVTRHSQIADQLHQQAYAPPPDPNNQPAPLGDPADAPPPADPAAAPVPVQPLEQVPLTPPPTDPAELLRENAGLRGGIAAMRGRLSAASHENTALKARITELEARPPAPAAPRDPGTSPASLITPELRAEYGEELLDVAARAAQERLSPELAELRNELQTLKGENKRTAEQQFADARSALHRQLDAEIPNWGVLNNDDRFLDWLDLQDQFSGVRRGDLLKAAYDGNDVPRVLAFFKGFLTEAAAVVPPSPAPAPAPVPKLDLTTMAAPGRGKSAPGNAPDSKPTYTHAQIAGFYADVTAGRYRGKDEQKKQIEDDIFAAQREGRIR